MITPCCYVIFQRMKIRVKGKWRYGKWKVIHTRHVIDTLKKANSMLSACEECEKNNVSDVRYNYEIGIARIL